MRMLERVALRIYQTLLIALVAIWVLSCFVQVGYFSVKGDSVEIAGGAVLIVDRDYLATIPPPGFKVEACDLLILMHGVLGFALFPFQVLAGSVMFPIWPFVAMLLAGRWWMRRMTRGDPPP